VCVGGGGGGGQKANKKNPQEAMLHCKTLMTREASHSMRRSSQASRLHEFADCQEGGRGGEEQAGRGSESVLGVRTQCCAGGAYPPGGPTDPRGGGGYQVCGCDAALPEIDDLEGQPRAGGGGVPGVRRRCCAGGA